MFLQDLHTVIPKDIKKGLHSSRALGLLALLPCEKSLLVVHKVERWAFLKKEIHSNLDSFQRLMSEPFILNEAQKLRELFNDIV